MSAAANLAEIKRTYQLLDDNFDAVYTKSDSDQRASLIALRDSARDAFWKAVATNLSDDNDVAVQTYNQLQAVNTQIQNDVVQLQNITTFLQTVAQAVTLAAALASLAAAA